MQFSTTYRNAVLDLFESVVGASAIIRVFSGSLPANCQAGDTGVKLAQYSLAADWMANAALGQKSFNNLPLATSGLASGNASYFRLYASDGVTCHMQGTVTRVAAAWSPATTYATGAYSSNGGNIYQATTGGTSAGAGGPTGTGTGIVDGTVQWQYVSQIGDLQVDNPSIVSGQNVSIVSYALSAPGA